MWNKSLLWNKDKNRTNKTHSNEANRKEKSYLTNTKYHINSIKDLFRYILQRITWLHLILFSLLFVITPKRKTIIDQKVHNQLIEGKVNRYKLVKEKSKKTLQFVLGASIAMTFTRYKYLGWLLFGATSILLDIISLFLIAIAIKTKPWRRKRCKCHKNNSPR